MQGLETNNYENPRIKNFINSFCPKHPEIITLNKKCQIFIVTLPYGASKRFHLF